MQRDDLGACQVGGPCDVAEIGPSARGSYGREVGAASGPEVRAIASFTPSGAGRRSSTMACDLGDDDVDDTRKSEGLRRTSVRALGEHGAVPPNAQVVSTAYV